MTNTKTLINRLIDIINKIDELLSTNANDKCNVGQYNDDTKIFLNWLENHNFQKYASIDVFLNLITKSYEELYDCISTGTTKYINNIINRFDNQHIPVMHFMINNYDHYEKNIDIRHYDKGIFIEWIETCKSKPYWYDESSILSKIKHIIGIVIQYNEPNNIFMKCVNGITELFYPKNSHKLSLINKGQQDISDVWNIMTNNPCLFAINKLIGCKYDKTFYCQYNGFDIKYRIMHSNDPFNLCKNSPSILFDKMILYFHGGGFICGDSSINLSFLTKLNTLTKIPIISIEYSVLGKDFISVDESIALYESILDGNLGFNVKQLILVGESAGCNIMMSMMYKLLSVDSNININKCVLIYPVLDLRILIKPSKILFCQDVILPLNAIMNCLESHIPNKIVDLSDPVFSPLLIPSDILEKFPDVKIIGAEFDPLLDDASELAYNFKMSNHPCDFLIANGLPHGFINFSILSSDINQHISNISKYIMK